MYEAELHYDDGRRAVIDVPDDAICGTDFCEVCGDCLSCYDDDPCGEYAWHTWIVAEEDLAQFLEEHTDARVR